MFSFAICYCVLDTDLPSQSSAGLCWKGGTLQYCENTTCLVDKIPANKESWLWSTMNAAVTNETATDMAGSSRDRWKVKKLGTGQSTVLALVLVYMLLSFQLWSLKTLVSVLASRSGTGELGGREGGLLDLYYKPSLHPILPHLKKFHIWIISSNNRNRKRHTHKNLPRENFVITKILPGLRVWHSLQHQNVHLLSWSSSLGFRSSRAIFICSCRASEIPFCQDLIFSWNINCKR